MLRYYIVLICIIAIVALFISSHYNNIEFNNNKSIIFASIDKDDYNSILKIKITRPLLNTYDTNGHTPLIKAIRYNRVSIAKYLIECGADPNCTSEGNLPPVFYAANEGESDIFFVLIQKGAVIKSSNELLIAAARGGNKSIIDYLINNGANIQYKDSTGISPLHMVRSKDTALLLLRYGADVNAVDNNGNTPLHVALEEKREDVVAVLIKNGAKVK